MDLVLSNLGMTLLFVEIKCRHLAYLIVRKPVRSWSGVITTTIELTLF